MMLALGVPALSSCHRAEAAPKESAFSVPPGEVRLTAQQVKDEKIVVGEIGPRPIDDTIIATGRVTFDDLKVARVYSPVTGRVVKIEGELGKRVKKGDRLATIDSPDMGEVNAALEIALADLITTQHAYERQKDLFAAHATSQRDLEASEDAYRKAKAEVERARAKSFLLHAGGGSYVQQGYTLTAPLDGEIIARSLTPGIEVQGLYGGAEPRELFTIGEVDTVWILADIFEQDLARVKVGTPVKVKVVSYPGEEFIGTVDWVASILDKETRTARVRCSFDNPKRLLKPEMYATVSFAVDANQVIAVPKSAVLHLGDSTMVFVEVGESSDKKVRYERRPVTVDEIDGAAFYPVLHGLSKGEKVVTEGGAVLSGML